MMEYFKKIIYFSITAVTMIFVVSCEKVNTDPDTNAIITQEVDRICDSIINHTELPGMMVGIWYKEKGLTYVKGKGVSNINSGVGMNPNQPFRIGSNTKSFVITTLMQLADEQLLTLDESLSVYFPSYPNADQVTLRMLCNMTSGIPNYTESPVFLGILETQPLKKWNPQELVDLAADMDYLFTPGTGLKYSNTNTVLAGLIIEQVTNKSLKENIETRFISKYKLVNTIFPDDHLMPDGGVSGYDLATDTHKYTADVTEKYDPSWAWGAGALISNIYDVKTWVEMLIDGTMLNPATHEQRFTGGFGTGPNIYGLGIFSVNGLWGHNGGLPGYTSIMMHDRNKDLTMVIFYNWQHEEITPDNLLLRLLEVVDPER